jgi:hypothetical protein
MIREAIPRWLMCHVGVLRRYKVAGHHGVGVSRAAFLYGESRVILCVVEACDVDVRKGIARD